MVAGVGGCWGLLPRDSVAAPSSSATTFTGVRRDIGFLCGERDVQVRCLVSHPLPDGRRGSVSRVRAWSSLCLGNSDGLEPRAQVRIRVRPPGLLPRRTVGRRFRFCRTISASFCCSAYSSHGDFLSPCWGFSRGRWASVGISSSLDWKGCPSDLSRLLWRRPASAPHRRSSVALLGGGRAGGRAEAGGVHVECDHGSC